MTDRLTLTRAFESAGMQSEAAERIATEIYDAHSQQRGDEGRYRCGARADLAAMKVELEHKAHSGLGQ